MAASLELHITNSLEALTSATAELADWLRTHEVSTAASVVAHMGIEELVTNCIKYGFDDKVPHVIEVTVHVDDSRLTASIVDDGRPFDPLGAPAPDLSLPPDQRPVGGLGLHLVRSMSDRMTYERRDDRNHVTIEKAL